MQITAPALCICFAPGQNKPRCWENGKSFPSPTTKAESVLKNVYRGAYFIFRLWPLARDLPRSASPPCRSAQTSIHFN